MQQVGGGANLTMQLLNGFLNPFRGCGEFRSAASSLLDQLCQVHSQDRECLTRAVMQFAGNATPLFVLCLQHTAGELTKQFGLPQNLNVSVLQLLRSRSDLGFQCLGKPARMFLSTLLVGNVHTGRVKKDNVVVLVKNRVKREIYQPFSTICPVITQCFVVGDSSRHKWS